MIGVGSPWMMVATMPYGSAKSGRRQFEAFNR